MRPKLYRHFDSDDNLLYIGVSTSILRRLSNHKSNAYWYDQIAKITIENFDTKKEMYEAEKKAIVAEKPRFNVCFAEKVKHTRGVFSLHDIAAYLTVPVGRVRVELQYKRFVFEPINKKPYRWLQVDVDLQMKKPEIATYVEELRR